MSSKPAITSYRELDIVDDPEERMRVAWLEGLMEDIKASPHKVLAMQAVADEHSGRLSFATVRRHYYAWLKHGKRGLVDKRKLRRAVTVPGWVECYMAYSERHNRSGKGGWRAMMADFWAGKAMPHGVGTWRDAWRAEKPREPVPAVCPPGWVPQGARYGQLQRRAKRNPHYGFQIVASRRGRGAAQEYLLPVLRTRAGLLPGQVYEADDLHIDVEVLMPGIGRVARPQKFVIYDIASGCQTASAMRPQYPEVKGERRNSLKEREFRMLHAHLLTSVGFHKDGVRIVVEHGTTAIRPDIERGVKAIPGFGALITYERSGILSEAVHAGMFKGDAGGNFRMKAYCEQAHRLEHSRRAMLPGQIGQDADHRPESHSALVRYDEMMMRAVMRLPEQQRELIRYNLCDWPTFAAIENILSDSIYDDPDHQLEGWADRMVTVWRLHEADKWRYMHELENYPEAERHAYLTLLKNNPSLVWHRRMTRREVWQSGQDQLVRVPIIELPALLDNRLVKKGGDARLVTIRKNGTFAFTDSFYYGPDEITYHANCQSRAGFRHDLVPGRSYIFFGTPMHVDAGVIVDPESGKTIGITPLYKLAPIADREAILHAAGAQNADLARKLMPIRGRHQQEAEARLSLIGHNKALLQGTTAPQRKDKRTSSKDIIPIEDSGDAIDRLADAYREDDLVLDHY